jgi:Spy/CpxP family protein refolding chaperone
MKQKLIVTTLAILLVAAGSLTANARNYGGGGYGPSGTSEYGCGQNGWFGGQNSWFGGHRQGRGEMVADIIGLSEEQQEQIEAIREEERNGNEALREKLWDYNDQMRGMTDAGDFDEKAIRAIAKEKAEVQAEMAVARARMQSRVHAIMTPEQQELAEKLRSTRRDRRGGFNRGSGGGRF